MWLNAFGKVINNHKYCELLLSNEKLIRKSDAIINSFYFHALSHTLENLVTLYPHCTPLCTLKVPHCTLTVPPTVPRLMRGGGEKGGGKRRRRRIEEGEEWGVGGKCVRMHLSS